MEEIVPIQWGLPVKIGENECLQMRESGVVVKREVHVFARNSETRGITKQLAVSSGNKDGRMIHNSSPTY